MKSWFRHFLPFGLVRATQLASEMSAIGLRRRHALAPNAAYRWQQLNLNLLPDGALQAPVGEIVDVGANAGDWAAGVLAFCQPARFTCVEPDPRLARRLRARFAGNPAVQVRESAVGEKSGSIDFNLMEDSVFNSVRQPTATIGAVYSSTFRVTEKITVPIQPLDRLLDGTGRIALLKIDVQGSEREVLAGATQTLARSDHVLLEANFRPHYEGEASFFELDRIMQEHGFAIGNYSKPLGGRKQALYADVLYLRSNS